MVIFIPSWYANYPKWSQEFIPWYFWGNQMSFDDTISQLKIFQEQQQEIQLLVLNYFPHLRTLFMRYGLHELPTISIFDKLQNISLSEMKAVHYTDFEWPKTVSFYHTAFALTAYEEGDLFASAEYNVEGRIEWIEYYHSNGELKSILRIDDRGFVSSKEYYAHHQLEEVEYLNANGQWQFKVNASTGEVIVHPEQVNRFYGRTQFSSLDELIRIELEQIMASCQSDDIIVIPSHERHNELLLETSTNQKKVFSFFLDRMNIEESEISNIIEQASLIIVDTNEKKQKLELLQQCGKHLKILEIPPFDTRLTLGKSQRQAKDILWIEMNSLEIHEEEPLVMLFIELMQSSKNIEVILTTKSSEQMHRLNHLLETIHQSDKDTDYLDVEIGETIIREKEKLPIQVQNLSSEEDVIQCLQKIRVVIDMGKTPNIFVQIASLSAGIPQINRVKSPYVIHGENGRVVETMDELKEAVLLYTEGLREWNKALIHTVRLLEEYTGEKMIEKWKESLEE